MIEPVNLLHSRFPHDQSSLQYTGMGIIPSVNQFFGIHSCIFIISDTNFRLFEIHPDFEICTLRNSDITSCAKFSVSKITHYTVGFGIIAVHEGYTQ